MFYLGNSGFTMFYLENCGFTMFYLGKWRFYFLCLYCSVFFSRLIASHEVLVKKSLCGKDYF